MEAATPAIEIRLSSIEEMETQATQLMQQHWEEVEDLRALRVLDPDWERYYTLEAQGLLLVLAAWNGDDLVGYSVSYVGRSSHYKGLVVAQNDALFVSPLHRRQNLGRLLLRQTEIEAHRRGAHLFLWHAKKDSRLERLMSSRLDGYVIDEVIFRKEL